MKGLKTFLSMMAIATMLFAVSCVDDTESQSVTDLRKAKAGQYNAEAALATAQAEAAKIVAESQKILAEAEAAYHKALVDQINAQTEIEKKKAEQELKRIIAETEMKLLKLQNELDIEILHSETELLRLQQELDALKAREHPALTQAINDYQMLLRELNWVKQDIANLKINLVRDQATLAGSIANEEEARDAAVRSFELDKANEEGKLANFEKSLDSWKKLAEDVTLIEDVIKTKKEEYEELIADRLAAFNDYLTKLKLENEAKINRDNFYFATFNYDEYRLYSLEEVTIIIREKETELADAQKELADSIATLTAAKAKIEPLYNDWQDAISATEAAEKERKAAEEALLKILEDDASDDDDIELAEANLTLKTKARDDASEEEVKTRNLYDAILDTVTRLENNVIALRNNCVFIENELARFNSIKDEFKGNSNRLVELDNIWNEAIRDRNAAEIAYEKIRGECEALGDEIYYLNMILINSEITNIENGGGTSGSSGWDITIQEIKKKIIEIENEITVSKNRINQYDRVIAEVEANAEKAIAFLEQAIEDLKAEIAIQEANLKILEARAEAAKKIIEQYTNE